LSAAVQCCIEHATAQIRIVDTAYRLIAPCVDDLDARVAVAAVDVTTGMVAAEMRTDTVVDDGLLALHARVVARAGRLAQVVDRGEVAALHTTPACTHVEHLSATWHA
jgi:hypothetical protein